MTGLRDATAAFPAMLRVGLSTGLAYPIQALMGIISTSLSLVMLAFWAAVADDGPLEGYDQNHFAAYFLACSVVRMLTSSSLVWEFNAEIRQGTLAVRLLRPIHPFLAFAADNLGSLPLRAALASPLALLLLPALKAIHFIADGRLCAIAALAVVGAWLLTFSVMLAVGTLGLYWESSVALWELWFGLFVIFSGYLLPLELLPGWLAPLVSASPFPYVLSFPVRTIVGLSTVGEAVRGLAIQWGYVALFLGAALLLWRRGLARFTAYGG